uniref:Uncharacterized protein n=1 Tax=Oryza rufipogon TaxID=4529 RepID=A0A0E0Q3A7_ORYRU
MATTTASNTSSVSASPWRLLLTAHRSDPSRRCGAMATRVTVVLSLTASMRPNASQKSLIPIQHFPRSY